MPEAEHERGLIDTSVVIDFDKLDPQLLPPVLAISTITLAELAAGPHAASNPAERAIRQERLQRAESVFDALPVDIAVARAFGRVYAAAGRKVRGRHALDLLIAATAAAGGLPLYTRNVADFSSLNEVVEIVAV